MSYEAKPGQLRVMAAVVQEPRRKCEQDSHWHQGYDVDDNVHDVKLTQMDMLVLKQQHRHLQAHVHAHDMHMYLYSYTYTNLLMQMRM